MKTITIFNYNFDEKTKREIEKLKWEHNVPFEGKVLDVVKEIYKKTDLNIFIQRGRSEEYKKYVTIFVTMYGRFGQR